MSGDTVAVGAYGQKGGGAVYMFERSIDDFDEARWTQTQKLVAADGCVCTMGTF